MKFPPPCFGRLLAVASAAMLLVLAASFVPGAAPTSHAGSTVTTIALDTDRTTPGVQSTTSYSAGASEIAIDAVVLNANGAAAFEFLIAWDIGYIDFVGWSLGPFLGSTGRTPDCNEILTENTLRLGCATAGQQPAAASGDGVLATLRFRPKLPGMHCFPLTLVETATIFGVPTPTVAQAGCIVLTPATPTKTSVPTKTIAPTKTVEPTRTHTPVVTHTPATTATVAPSSTRPAATRTRAPSTSAPRTETPAASTTTPVPSSTVSGGSAPNVRCPLSAGYWRDHPESWPVQELSLGVLVYNRGALQALLASTRTDDPSISLAANLIAARFNTGIGVDARSIYVDLVLADRLIGGFGARVPLGIDRDTPVGRDMAARGRRLEAFNRTCEGLTSDVLGGEAATPGITPGDLPSSGSSGDGGPGYLSWILGSMILLVVALLLLVGRQLLDSRRPGD